MFSLCLFYHDPLSTTAHWPLKHAGETPSLRTGWFYPGHVEQSSEKPPGQWNTYEISCKADTIRCYVNGVLQNEGTGATDTAGWICLQSEGGPIEFRNIYIEPLDWERAGIYGNIQKARGVIWAFRKPPQCYPGQIEKSGRTPVQNHQYFLTFQSFAGNLFADRI